MKLLSVCITAAIFLSFAGAFPSPANAPPAKRSKHLRPVLAKRDGPQFAEGEPIDGLGKGAPFGGPTNHAIDLQNPDNLGQQPTDAGTVVNLKYSFSDSKTRILKGGWVREMTVTDLPSSVNFAAAQLHLTKGAVREMHWHKVDEWGYVYQGKLLMSVVDQNGDYQVSTLNTGDVYYIPHGVGHTLQGLEDQNEFLHAFDTGNFDAIGTSFNLDDWLVHIPRTVLAKNLGLSVSALSTLPAVDPYFVGPFGPSTARSSGSLQYVYPLSQMHIPTTPGGGGTMAVIDSRNFPIATGIAATVVTLNPGALRELHWNSGSDAWLFFVSGHATATVFVGSASARTFDFSAGDTAVFPDSTGHYMENLSSNETCVFIALFKSAVYTDVSLTQWLALTPADIVAATLNVSVAVVQGLKREKQIILA